jgi:hypothetical protein
MFMTFFILMGLVVASIFFYVFLMIFYPEWVGITGKNAKKFIDSHKEGTHSEESSFFKEFERQDKPEAPTKN